MQDYPPEEASPTLTNHQYQLESQPLLPCELAREKAVATGAPYIPQCSEEGLYRNVQCDRNGATCWCVDVDGAEVPGSRASGSPTTCLSFCQLKKQQILLGGYLNSSSTSFIPRCKDSGGYEPVQYDQQRGEFWCVDREGMEIYGTRQMGAPLQCPQSCAVRDRRILHDVGEKNPPQCSQDGGFHPVQCKLVNTTNQMVLDVVMSFSRFPNTFRSFKSLRESFPEVSGYCYCADALGRELEGTGLEMLLDEIYDTVFSGLPLSRSFPDTAVYRMLQRRFLGVQLITAGRFRCPTACEVQRFTSARMEDVYTPSCEDDGGYKSVQCQEGGQCWCVDARGQEVAGSRTAGETPKCDNLESCTTRRRQALSTLFYGPVGHFSQQNLFFTQEEESGEKISSRFCPSYLVETFLNSGLFAKAGQDAEELRIQLRTFLGDTILGLFTSKTQVEFALQFSSNPIKFQQTLFGGKFLKNLGSFNFTGAVGTNSKFSFSNFFQQIGLTGMYSGGNFKELAKLFSPEEDSYLTKNSSNLSRPDFNLNQPIMSSFGRTVNLQENRKRVEFFESILEQKEFSAFLRDVVSLPPSVAEDIFEAVKMLVESEACEIKVDGVFVPTCTNDGKYEEIQCSRSECWCVDEQGREIQETRTPHQQPTCSSKCLRERKTQIAFQKSQSAGSDVYIPACDQKGNYLTVQCTGKHCFCVDLEGKNIPGTQKLSGDDIQCPSSCQLAASDAFLQTTKSLLSVPTLPLDPLQVYIPQCSPEGEWRGIQCSGPTEQAFELYERWTKQAGTVSFSDTLKVIMKYKEESSSQRFSDFVQTLYDNGHQNVFPAFSQYSLFSDVPQEILEGNVTLLSSDNVLVNPYVVWRLMSGSLSYYPGSYSDFSTPLGHQDTRNCWCVNMDGEKLEGTETPPNKVPKCPGSCQLALLKNSQFLEDARNIIAASNLSHFPLAYNFLLARGLQLSERDLLYTQDQRSGLVLSEKFLSKDSYGLKLAAYSTLQFFWQNGINSRETTQLSYIPYSPQCDGLGNWEPVQFYQGTGHYWCVDDEGSYIPGSIVTRTSGPPQCQTSCQQAQTNSLISNWMPKKSAAVKTGTTSLFIPRCTESGQYAALQKSETESWCVHPISGRVVLQDFVGLENITCPSLCTISGSEDPVLGEQFSLSCDENGNPARERCDLERNQCVCIFVHGEEAAGTQVTMSERPGARPALARKVLGKVCFKLIQSELKFSKSTKLFKALLISIDVSKVADDSKDRGHSLHVEQSRCRHQYRKAFFTPLDALPLVPLRLVVCPLVALPLVVCPLVALPLVVCPLVALPLVVCPLVALPLVVCPLVARPLVVRPLVVRPLVALPLVVLPLVALPPVALPPVALPLVVCPLVALPLVPLPLVALPLVALPLVVRPLVARPLVARPLVALPLVALPLVVRPPPLVRINVLSPVAPLCPLPFGAEDVKHGSVFCREFLESGEKSQRCHVRCHKGYSNVFPGSVFTCDPKTQRWTQQPPQVQACQRLQSFHTVHTQAWFQLMLPPGKMCMGDYAGVLQAFQALILDDLKSRGLCDVQVTSFATGGGRLALCDDSAVRVECLSSNRLGVNVTWTARLQHIPEAALPSLHDVEAALAAEDVVGRLLSLVRTGSYALNLESKLFVADKSDFLPEDAAASIVTVGCDTGFQKVLNSRRGEIRDAGGCGVCPAGSYSVDGECTLCPVGSYQEEAGTRECRRCPLGTTTLYSGAYSRSHCVTDCQRNQRGLRCDDRGQFIPSQRDAATNKYFCADNSGEKIMWTETDMELTDDQCLLFRRFELVPEGNVLVSNEDSGAPPGLVRQKREALLDCIVDCAADEDCDYLTESTNGTGVICQLYAGDGGNIVCTADNQIPDALGNAASSSMEGLHCQYEVRQVTADNVAVYRKRGHEFAAHRGFTRTDFTNIASGVYSAVLFPSSGGVRLTDGYFMCRQLCTQDSCCDGFILSQVILNQGGAICALLRSPDVLLCSVNDWSQTTRLGGDGVCRGVKSNPEQKTFSFFLGGQEFSGSYALLSQSIGMADYSLKLSEELKTEIQEAFFGFKRVFLLKDGEKTQLSVTECPQVDPRTNITSASAAAMEHFLPVNSEDVVIKKDIAVGNIEYWISKDHYSSDRALSWCLTRCLEEESWCRLADLRDGTAGYFSCLIYPDTWNCSYLADAAPDHCNIALHEEPQSLHHMRETLGTTVKHFYSLIPYRTLTAVSVRNRIAVTGTSVSKGFFQCELRCDADPCCKGFGYLQQTGVQGPERMCLLVSSLGIQSCAEQDGDSWRIFNCSFPNKGTEVLPFGWYQKPADQKTIPASLCPSADITASAEAEVSLEDWVTLDVSSVALDPSLSEYDTVQIDLHSAMTLSAAQSFCLSECDRAASCVTTAISVQQTAIKCTFYPETQTCHYSLRGPRCQLLVRESATVIYRKRAPARPTTSLTISQGNIVGKPGSISIGSDVKNVNQFLGVPYAVPPTGESRFRPPQPYTWTGTWNATFIRPSCLQPGDGKAQYSSVSEDCLYLNLFVPQHSRIGSPVLLYFHNSPKDYAENGQTFVDGSYLAAVGDVVVVTAGYRVGVFGFLSTGNAVPSGNWGLLDQTAALKWVQENIAYFGGDPEQISIIADRAGADLASIHLLFPETQPVKRAALMGGSAFSPMLPVSERRARQQVQSLAEEMGCPRAGSEETLSCLRKVDANTLNTAQTKLLAVQGPFQTWGPVVDGVYLQDTPTNLLQQKTSQHIDLLIGSSEHDGLVSRSMAIKRFEEAEGRGESKMAFYQALQNSLGGEEMNPLVQGAAAWYYALQHSSDEYAVFSRGLENATRDHFIACPVIKMAERWSENGRGHVYMYYFPESYSQGSSSLDLPEDIIYVFGIPFHPNYKSQFSAEEQNLSLQIMQYLANFVRTGNPNFSYNFSRKRNVALPSWPEHRAHISGDRYKEFSQLLPNNQGLKKAECSFWNQLVPALKSSASLQTGTGSSKNITESGLPSAVTSASRKEDKGSYA
ncbi:thyroglobulin [Eleutherodactylus coqui]|uniref:thyroglobulin n=1 Tax=Eleutherodactylus coqui TaxID=57060 RepID=UPI0034618DFF